MKKVLIWDVRFNLRNCGGPTGYLYNIHEYLKCHPCDNIVFLSDLLNKCNNHHITCKNCSQNKNQIISHLKRSVIGRFLSDIRLLYNMYILKGAIGASIDLEYFDIIHFHIIYDLFKYERYIKNYNGIILMTSHMPEPPINEISSNFKMIGPLVKKYKELLIKYELNKLQKYQVRWMFPTKYALEPYCNGSLQYNDYFSKIEDKIHYVTTSILDVKIQSNNDEFRKKYSIPENAFLITYLGRHNHVKGYNVLKEIGEKVLQKSTNVVFLIGGKEEPLKGLDNKNWKELGWVTNSAEILFNSDLFILPNNETYFDIAFLEVLRAGTPILATLTGGNKYFKYELKEEETKGIFFFEKGDVNGALAQIAKVMRSNSIELGEHNRKLWENYFTIEKYVANYSLLINNLK